MKIIIILIFTFIIIFFRSIIINFPNLLYWKIIDVKNKDTKYFPEYGCWFFVGRQGSGKTMSLVYTLENFRNKYPECKIYTNFGYKNQDRSLDKLSDLLDYDLYNGKSGTIFAIDEIQNEFDCYTSKEFPASLLSVITQQRKNHIIILCTSQVFTRVSKPLREQAYKVIECKTLLGRYTQMRYYDGYDYADSVDRSENYKDRNRKRLKYESFVQTDELRSLYDSYAIISRLGRDKL